MIKQHAAMNDMRSRVIDFLRDRKSRYVNLTLQINVVKKSGRLDHFITEFNNAKNPRQLLKVMDNLLKDKTLDLKTGASGLACATAASFFNKNLSAKPSEIKTAVSELKTELEQTLNKIRDETQTPGPSFGP